MAYKNITLTDSNPGNYFYEEAMKTLRTNVQFSGKNNKVILLTSGHGNEGKSDISFNLAVELGKAGKKVLLIDADIRKSVYKERYNIQEETKGLSQYLSGQVEQIDEVVCKTNYENVYMILAGLYAPNPTEMLGDELFGQLLKAAKEIPHKQAWIIHGFRGKEEQATQLLRAGFYLSFGEKFNSDTVKSVPLKRIFIESDESKKNIEKIYSEIATLKGCKQDLLEQAILGNYNNIFE